jgi:hypothetical protein
MYASRRCLEEKQPYSSPLETSYCKQASTYFNVWLFLLAACSNQCPHTRWCQFHWVKAPQLASEPPWFTPYSQGHVSHPLEGALLPNISQIVDRELAIRSWASISSPGRLHNRTLVFRACLTCPVLVLGPTTEGRYDVIRGMSRQKSVIAVVLKSALLFIVFCDDPLT